MSSEQWMDITQPLTNKIAEWPGDRPFIYELTATKEVSGSVNVGYIKSSVHTGTHIDAPFHFLTKGARTESFELDICIGNALIIDLTEHNQLGITQIEKYNIDNIKRLIIKSSNHRNPNHFPEHYLTINPDVVPYLHEKGIQLIGTDAPSVDPISSKTLKAHHALANHGIYILENLLLNDIEEGIYELIVLPLRIVGADASPARAIIRSI